MQEDTSSPLTELLDGGTILMDVFKIQGLNRYFDKFRDEFDGLLIIQGRIWGITRYSSKQIKRDRYAANTIDSIYTFFQKKNRFNSHVYK